MDNSVKPKQPIRRSFEIKDKQNAVTLIDELVSSGCSWRKACRGVRIPYLYYRCWKKLIKKVDSINGGTKFVSFNTKGTSHHIIQVVPVCLIGLHPKWRCLFFMFTNRAFLLQTEWPSERPHVSFRPLHKRLCAPRLWQSIASHDLLAWLSVPVCTRHKIITWKRQRTRRTSSPW